MATANEISGEDRLTAIRQALAVFWRQGAEATSYNDIVAATGLSRKALYGLWPDKGALIHEAMVTYRAEVLAPLVARLDRHGRAGLKGFWDGLSEGVKSHGWCGCFLFRSASGALRADPVVARHFDAHVELLRQGIHRAAAEAIEDRTIGAEIDPATASWQSVAIAGMISTCGAITGNSSSVRSLIAAGRAACGLSWVEARASR
ncbi:MAG: TetR/AcrR family transcriptional regulator [Devosia sp.]